MSSLTSFDRRIAVAPMMDYTDRHCRFFLRLLSPSALLYTEMVTATAVLRGNPARLLDFHPDEHPLALQLGGNDPKELAAAACVGEAWGYDEINLNCGCPSDRVQDGRFGACLMAEPERVAQCVRAMREAVRVPVTVKCRIAIDPLPARYGSQYECLRTFVGEVAQAGCETFIVHARIAVLGGLNPKQNREIPPLRYEWVARLREELPHLKTVINGGIRSLSAVREHLRGFDGVMIGREAYQSPYLLALLHQQICDPAAVLPDRDEVVRRYAAYVSDRLSEGHRLSAMTRPLQGLYAGLPRARAWRRYLSEQSSARADAEVLLHALRIVAAAA